jgi:DNA-binding NtrC family response regulator
MADIILAGGEEERLVELERSLADAGERVERIAVDIADHTFVDRVGDRMSGVVIARFHDGDLASIKAMQKVRLKKPCLGFIFVCDKELPYAILTLMFNEGAYGVLTEPVNGDGPVHLIRQAIKRSKWDLDENSEAEELRRFNVNLQNRVEYLENESARTAIVYEKLERLVFFLLSDKTFKASRVKILFITDSPYQKNIMTELFGKLGFNLKGVDSGEEARDLIKEFKPDIVVSDLELAGVNGVALAKEVKGTAGYPPVHFIILTANEDKRDWILSPETKVDDCVIKPSDPVKYKDMVARIALGILSI